MESCQHFGVRRPSSGNILSVHSIDNQEFKLAKERYEANQFDDSLFILRKLISQVNPNSPLYLEVAFLIKKCEKEIVSLLIEEGSEHVVTDEYKTAYTIFDALAKQNHVEALFQLGLMYVGSHYVEKDEARALALLTEAFNKGHELSALYLGWAYETLVSVQDLKAALYWYENTKNEGNTVASHRIPGCELLMLAKGKEVVKNASMFDEKSPMLSVDEKVNYKVAYDYFDFLAQRGNQEAKFQLGLMHFYGQYVRQNPTEAQKIFLGLVKDTSPRLIQSKAAYMLGEQCWMSPDSIHHALPFPEKAIAYYQKSLEMGLLLAEERVQEMISFALLCVHYGDLDTSPKNDFLPTNFFAISSKYNLIEKRKSGRLAYYQTACDILTFLADAGNREAQFQLGLMYMKGNKDIKQSNTHMIHYLEMANKQGHPEAALKLGDWYLTSSLLRKADTHKAIQCYVSASNKGSEEARLKIAHLF